MGTFREEVVEEEAAAAVVVAVDVEAAEVEVSAEVEKGVVLAARSLRSERCNAMSMEFAIWSRSAVVGLWPCSAT